MQVSQDEWRTKRTGLACVVLWVSVISPAGGCTEMFAGQPMADPLFGITYNPQEVHFEEAPASVSQLCRMLRGRKLWVYARSKRAGSEYFIVSGLARIRPDGPGPSHYEADFGTAVRILSRRCTTDDAKW